MTLRIDGVVLADNVFGTGGDGTACGGDERVAQLEIPDELFAQLSSDGAIVVDIEPSSDATSAGCADARLHLRLEYRRPLLDCDGNGIDDECQIDVEPQRFDCNSDGVLDACQGGPWGPDCDQNGVADVCDIAAGANDANSNGRLDICENRYGDLTLDGLIDGADLAGLLASWGATSAEFGDLNSDGTVDALDLAVLLARWGPIS